MDETKELLKKKELRVTQIRCQVLEAFQENEHALSPQDLQALLGGLDRVSLYRTLQVLLDKGLVHKALEKNTQTYYALCDSDCSDHAHSHQHVHFTCESCEKVYCLEQASIQVDTKGYQVHTWNLNASGLCVNCR